jgi:hypothetical protein
MLPRKGEIGTPETLVELAAISVLRVRADWKAGGPPAAFETLESKLTSLRGRRFYGMFYRGAGEEEYSACVARTESDDPVRMGLEAGEIPAGWYARRRIRDWEEDTTQIAVQFRDLIRVLGENVDSIRPEIEFYRSQGEMFVLEPVKGPAVRPGHHPSRPE